MTRTFTLSDSLALHDLQVYLGRAARVEEGSVRLIGGGGVLAVYVAVFYPVGLLDEAPTVLGLRTFAIAEADGFDSVVPIRSLLERLSRLETNVSDRESPVVVTMPMEVNTVTWAAISPPKGGWLPLPATSSSVLGGVAKSGIDEVATSIPTGTGEQIVHRVRSEVWGRPIDTLEHVPAGGAFAALSLGFLADGPVGADAAASDTGGSDSVGEDVRIFETGPWTRLTTERGHVLIKRKAWTLAR